MLPVADDTVSLNDRQNLEYRLGEIAEKIEHQGEKRREIADIIKKAKQDFRLPTDDEDNQIIEPELVYPVENTNLDDLVIAGVDGGVLNKPLHGLDLILVRAVVSIFSYTGGDLEKADYHPNEMPIPELINIHEPLDSRELEVLVGMKRQLTELKRATEVVRDRDLNVLMLDGSVVPQYTNHTSGFRTKELYKDLMEAFTDLYKECESKDVLLLGAIKDSRSARIARIFRNKILPKFMEDSQRPYDEISSLEKNKNVLENSRDTAFLDYMLDRNERSFTFSYADAPAGLLADLGDWKKHIYAFYVKPAPYDRPVRVEVISNQKETLQIVDEAASVVNTLSASHEACALPSVLIEADARAALAEEEISILRDNIADRLDPSTMLDLRRERRPF